MNLLRSSLFLLSAILFLHCNKADNEASDKFTNQYKSMIDSLVLQEKSFAEAASKNGIKAAFLQYLAIDGVVFRPVPVNGHKVYTAYDDSGKSMEWFPTLADIASSYDIGFTTGPWVYTYTQDTDSLKIYGHYISVWQKQQDGSWKVIFDAGISHDSLENYEESKIYPSYINSVVKMDQRELHKADESEINNILKSIHSAARDSDDDLFRSLTTKDVFFYVDNSEPYDGIKECMDYFASIESNPDWMLLEAVYSEANDFLMAYGIVSEDINTEMKHNSFAVIMRDFKDEGWKVIGLVFNEIEEETVDTYF